MLGETWMKSAGLSLAGTADLEGFDLTFFVDTHIGSGGQVSDLISPVLPRLFKLPTNDTKVRN